VLDAFGAGEVGRMTYFAARFTSPVKPGDEIETSMWEIGTGPNGTTEIAFVTKNVTSGKLSLGNGTAFVVVKESSKL